MDKLKQVLKKEGHLNTLYLINQGINEEDIYNLCEEYKLTRKTEVKGCCYMIQFYKNEKQIQNFNQLF